MCENIRQTFGIRSIWVGGKTDQTFVIKVQPQWMKTGEQNVDPKVIFGVIDQVGFGHIFLND